VDVEALKVDDILMAEETEKFGLIDEGFLGISNNVRRSGYH
jgi:hypothetical protein